MAWAGLAWNGRLRWVLASSLAVVSGASLVACQGGAGRSVTSTPGQPTPGAVAGTPTPVPQPTIEGSSFYFPGRGYASVIPDGWHADPNSLRAGAQTVDAFFSTVTVEGVQTNISVTCEANPSNVPTQQFFENRLATLRGLNATDVKLLGSVTVGGVAAQKISYTVVRSTTTIQKVDVMLATPKCGWTLALASAPAQASQSLAVFEKFLQSFQLISDSSSGS